jgi:hypothetical protein
MWVKGTPMHFIIDTGRKKNIILEEVFKWLALAENTIPKTLHHWMAPPRKRSLHQPTVLHVIQQQTL